MNARFDGGFPFSYSAGADFPGLLIKMVNNEKIDLPDIEIATKAPKADSIGFE